MAAAKKSTANHKTSKGQKPAGKTSRIINDDDEKALSPARVREIYLFVYLAVSVFMLCSNFGICGSVGNVISGFFFGLFGFTQYLLPFYLFFAAAFILSNGPKKSIIRKLIWIAVLLMVISFIAQLVHGVETVTAKSLYMDGYSDHKGGGFIFGGILTLLYKLIGKVGVIILTILLTIVAVIMITGFSVINGMKRLLAPGNGYEDPDYDDEEDEPAYVPARPRRPRQEMLRDLEVRKSEDAPAGQKGRRSRAIEKKAEVSKDEMTELHPDPYNDDMDQLKEAARAKLRAKKNAEAEDTAFPGVASIDGFETKGVVPVSKDRGLSVPSSESIRRTKGGPVIMDESGRPAPNPAYLPETKDEPVDFFNLKPAPESYDDEVGGDFLTSTAEAEESNVREERRPSAAATRSASPRKPEAAAETADDEDMIIPGRTSQDTKVTHQDTQQATDEISRQLQAKPDQPKRKPYRIPPVNLLNPVKKTGGRGDADVRETAMKLKSTMESFGVNVTITDYSRGPAVTRYEMTPEQGVKVSKILSLQDDIKLNLAAADIRIEAPIPGKSAIGIEVPNKENQMVSFRELIDTETFRNAKSKISFAIGKDIGGQIIIGDIAKMPHMLIAGSTGSGKSVCINTIIMSILYKAKPEEVRLIMVDPKMVELTAYNGIPHMLIPVVTDPKKAAGALNWAVQEMERRYKLFARYNVRNLEGFNKKVEEEGAADPEDLERSDFRFTPQIVVIVDELADLMMVAHGEVEDAIVRLSQLARAAGIHLIIATQRPSVDVITGLIKANVPSRIAFAVSSGTDSRTILDMVGAEKLLGKGDMLYYPTGIPKPLRVQGAFVSDEEVVAVTDYIKKQCGDTEYDESVAQSIESGSSGGSSAGGGSSEEDEGERFDEYFEEAGRLVIEKDKASIGYLQRVFRIGFNRAARIMDQLADAGVVGPEEGTKPRKILMTIDQFEEFMQA